MQIFGAILLTYLLINTPSALAVSEPKVTIAKATELSIAMKALALAKAQNSRSERTRVYAHSASTNDKDRSETLYHQINAIRCSGQLKPDTLI